MISDVQANGGAGGKELAEKVVELAGKRHQFQFVYNEEDSIETKLNKIKATKVMEARRSPDSCLNASSNNWKSWASPTILSVWLRLSTLSQTIRNLAHLALCCDYQPAQSFCWCRLSSSSDWCNMTMPGLPKCQPAKRLMLTKTAISAVCPNKY